MPSDAATIEEAEQVLESALPLLEQAAGGAVEGSVSTRHDPMDVIEEALHDGDFHEVILSTLPHHISRLAPRGSPPSHRAPRCPRHHRDGHRLNSGPSQRVIEPIAAGYVTRGHASEPRHRRRPRRHQDPGRDRGCRRPRPRDGRAPDEHDLPGRAPRRARRRRARAAAGGHLGGRLRHPLTRRPEDRRRARRRQHPDPRGRLPRRARAQARAAGRDRERRQRRRLRRVQARRGPRRRRTSCCSRSAPASAAASSSAARSSTAGPSSATW